MNKCPDYVYKYCARDVYENHIMHGSFRLGTLAEYRTVFESKGAEYGDSCEGNEILLIKGPVEIAGQEVGEEGVVIADQHVNAYVFSTALTYSKVAHQKWYERNGCGYDLCLKLRAEDFFIELAHKIRFRVHGDRSFMLAKPIYGNNFVELGKDSVQKGDKYLYKTKKLEWEDEYRLVCSSPRIMFNSATPIYPKSLKIIDFIEEVFDINC
jgi:hypothetical protein